MFIIRNTTDRDVVLDDLRIILGPHKQIDLDRVAARHLIDASPKLRMAFQQQRVATVAKDGEQVVSSTEGVSSDSLRQMEDRLKAEFKRQLATMARPTAESQQVDELTNMIRLLAEQLKKTQGDQSDTTKTADSKDSPPPPTPNSFPSTSDGISDDTLNKIHAKTMKRLEGKITGHVEQESKTITDKNVARNVDELEGLL